MGRKASKAKSLVRVELGCGGLLGLGVVAFCIFLWMYLFGVWTGQSGLQSTLATGDPRELVSAATKMMKGNAPAAVTPGDAGVAGGDESQTPAPASTPASASSTSSPAPAHSGPVAASAKPSSSSHRATHRRRQPRAASRARMTMPPPFLPSRWGPSGMNSGH